MERGPNLGIWVLESIPGIMNGEQVSHRTRSSCSSLERPGGAWIPIATVRTSTGLHSKNICPNPIDDNLNIQQGMSNVKSKENDTALPTWKLDIGNW